MSETTTTVATAAGSIYRKSDQVKSKIPLIGLPNTGSKGSQKGKVKSPLEEPKRKHQRQESESEEESRIQQEEQAKELLLEK